MWQMYLNLINLKHRHINFVMTIWGMIFILNYIIWLKHFVKDNFISFIIYNFNYYKKNKYILKI